jgi:hypothetical protein
MPKPYAPLDSSGSRQEVEDETTTALALPAASPNKKTKRLGVRRLTFQGAARLAISVNTLRKRGRMRALRSAALNFSGLVVLPGVEEEDGAAMKRAVSRRDDEQEEEAQEMTPTDDDSADEPVRLDPKANTILYTSSINAFLVMACNTMFMPGLAQVKEDLNTSYDLVALALTVYMIASTFQPLTVGQPAPAAKPHTAHTHTHARRTRAHAHTHTDSHTHAHTSTPNEKRSPP